MYTLSEEQRMILDVVREVARERIAPRAMEIDHRGEYPWDIKKALADLDILGLAIPQEYGGTSQGLLFLCMAIEELTKPCASSGLILMIQSLGALPIELAGSPDQKKRYFPRMATGEWLGAFALTEPNAGSDAAAIQTRAVKKGDTYILNGTKRFITNADVADVIVTFALTDPGKGAKGISAFIVEKGFSGFSIGKHEEKMGIRGSTTCEVIFQDCEVPATNLLGREGDGFKIAMMTLDRSRPEVGAQAVGIAQGAIDYAIAYAKERHQFGQPIANFQGIQFMLADMAMQTEAARQLVYHAAALFDAGQDATIYSAMAKCFASDVAMKVTTDAVQILGGYGYIKEYPVERMMRDAKITQIYEGTNQIQRLVISRELLKR